jgi:glycosyltransferase involved in cell wall biosynthesis
MMAGAVSIPTRNFASREPSIAGESMTEPKNAGRRVREVVALGRIPPPVTGMTLVTKAVVDALQAAGPVDFRNWSVGSYTRTLGVRLRYALQILRSIGHLLRRGRVPGEPLYMLSNSEGGLYSTALLVFVARRLGYVVYLHHHVYYYIDRHDWRMAWIDRCLGDRGVHVVHSEQMIEDFRRRYPTRCGFAIVHPSVMHFEFAPPREGARTPFRIGILSSLSLAKGIDLVIQTFETLRARGRDVTLTLAGAAPNAKSRELVRQALEKYPDRIQHLGPIYGDAKAKFYADVDAFIFPTQSESWGLVLHESLAAGVPAITYDRGCTATVVGPEAGRLIPATQSFVEPAVEQIERWMDHGDEYRRASQAAVAQAERLCEASRRTLAEFVAQIFSAGGTDRQHVAN